MTRKTVKEVEKEMNKLKEEHPELIQTLIYYPSSLKYWKLHTIIAF